MSKLLFFAFLFSFSMVATDGVFEWDTPTAHDFGDIQQHRPVTVDFVIHNTSEEPFLIDNVRTACGCTAPDWTYDPIEPGAYSTIKVTFDAKKVGYFKKKVKVFLSCQRKAENLSIEGWVE